MQLEQPGALDQWRYGERGTLSEIPATELTEDAWQFADSETRALFDRVRTRFPERLGGVAEIFVGVQTSADPVYIIRAGRVTAEMVVHRWDDRDWPIERAILRPCLHDVPLSAYARPAANAWIIFPYDLTTTGKAHLVQPSELAHRFPKCWAYLNARRSDLVDRNIIGGATAERQWYQFGRSQSLTKFNTPKIILPALSLEPRYAYDDANVVVTGGGN